MSCPYCDQYMLLTYNCPCSPQHVVCRNCSQIDCFECQGRLKPTPTKQMCSSCFTSYPPHKIFIYTKSRKGYCVQCCYNAYISAISKKNDQKFIKLGKIITIDVPFTEIQQFLAKFCVKCKKYLSPKRKMEQQDIRLNKKHYCDKCFEQQTSNNGIKDKKQYLQILKSKGKTEKINNIERTNNSLESIKVQLNNNLDKDKTNQVAKCMSCDRKISKYSDQGAVFTNNIVICYICARMSQMSEQRYQQENYYKEKQTIKQKSQNDYLSPERRKIFGEDKSSNKKIQQSMKTDIKEKTQKSKTQNTKSQKPNSIRTQKNRESKPITSQLSSPKIVLDLKWLNDEQFATCHICGLQILATCAIWQEVGSRSLCRICYCQSFHLLQSKPSRQFPRQEQSPTRMKNNYVEKKPEDRTQSKKKQKNFSYLDKKDQNFIGNFEKVHKNQYNLNQSPGRKQTISLSKNIATRNQEPSYKCSKCHGYSFLSGKYRIGEEIVCLSCKSAQSLKEKSFPQRYI